MGDYMEKKFFNREELVGKLVIDQEAHIAGTIKDIALTEDGKMGLLIGVEGAGDKLINLNEIQKIRDVVLLKSEVPRERAPILETSPKPVEIDEESEPIIEPVESAPTPEEPRKNVCSSCGHENRPTSKFCVKCGITL